MTAWPRGRVTGWPHGRVDLIAMLARLVDDPREYDRLVRLERHRSRDGRVLARLHIGGHAFDVLERAVLAS